MANLLITIPAADILHLGRFSARATAFACISRLPIHHTPRHSTTLVLSSRARSLAYLRRSERSARYFIDYLSPGQSSNPHSFFPRIRHLPLGPIAQYPLADNPIESPSQSGYRQRKCRRSAKEYSQNSHPLAPLDLAPALHLSLGVHAGWMLHLTDSVRRLARPHTSAASPLLSIG